MSRGTIRWTALTGVRRQPLVIYLHGLRPAGWQSHPRRGLYRINGADYVCLKKREALPQRSFFCVSGPRLDQARMLSTD